MKLYNFNRLINKYSCDFTLVTRERGSYDGGIYTAGAETETAMRGAIVPLSERKVYQSGGHYTSEDRDLYMRSPITEPLEDCRVKYKGKTFSVEEEQDFSEYADVWEYVLRRVSTDD